MNPYLIGGVPGLSFDPFVPSTNLSPVPSPAFFPRGLVSFPTPLAPL